MTEREGMNEQATTEQEKPDLSKIEPIGKAEEPEEGTRATDEPWTSPETEDELEKLRRG